MKRLTILLIATILVKLSLCQDFISTDKQWNVMNSWYGGFQTEIFKIEGDSSLNEFNYNKIWTSFDSTISWTYMGLLREENNVVYYVPEGSNEGVLYDFNLEEGDEVLIRNFFCVDTEVPVTITEIDTVEIMGADRKRWHLSTNDYPSDIWIEGIGSVAGPLYSMYEYCIVCPIWELLCCHQGNDLIYSFYEEPDCFRLSVGVEKHDGISDLIIKPNPVNQGQPIEIETEARLIEIHVFNTSGTLIKEIEAQINQSVIIPTNDLKTGVYFIKFISEDGRFGTEKVIVM